MKVSTQTQVLFHSQNVGAHTDVLNRIQVLLIRGLSQRKNSIVRKSRDIFEHRCCILRIQEEVLRRFFVIKSEHDRVRFHRPQPGYPDQMLHAFAHGFRHGQLDEGLNPQMINQTQPVWILLDRRIDILTRKFANFHMADDIKSSFLQIVHEVNERTGGTRRRDHQQHLGTPEFDVIFPGVQHQQILSDLVEYQCLRYTAPWCVFTRREQVQHDDQN